MNCRVVTSRLGKSFSSTHRCPVTKELPFHFSSPDLLYFFFRSSPSFSVTRVFWLMASQCMSRMCSCVISLGPLPTLWHFFLELMDDGGGACLEKTIVVKSRWVYVKQLTPWPTWNFGDSIIISRVMVFLTKTFQQQQKQHLCVLLSYTGFLFWVHSCIVSTSLFRLPPFKSGWRQKNEKW